MVPDRNRRALLRRLVATAALAGGGLLPGCLLLRELGAGGDDPQWLERRYTDASPSDVLQIASSVLEPQYPPRQLDLYRGVLETGWVYGLWADHTHQPLRQRVCVEAHPDGGAILVRLRVQRESSPTAGRHSAGEQDEWEPYDDDPSEARRLLTRVHIVLQEIARPVVEGAGESGGR